MEESASLRREGAVATLVLNRPERRNALELEMWRRLTATPHHDPSELYDPKIEFLGTTRLLNAFSLPSLLAIVLSVVLLDASAA